ncbi:hypothetical protein [Pontibacter pamirensis]|uniref:hypothetical protein n=1 Tax=Pontibacter pamirensis TaxID=2562824 RepID=UPI00138A5BCE|nr:hypothetical protein [Pontibacter pamirensis]
MPIPTEIKYSILLARIEKLKGAETGTREEEQLKALNELAEEFKSSMPQPADLNPNRKSFNLFYRWQGEGRFRNR